MRYRHLLAVAAGCTLALAVASAAPALDTTVTAIVEQGSLVISVPAAANIGAGSPGATLSGQLGSVTVTDGRGALTASWTASVTSTDFTTGGATAAETIPKSAVAYWSGTATATTGLGTFAPGQATVANAQSLDASRTAFSHPVGVGNNSATWNPTLRIALPAAAVTGTYTGTVTHTVL